MTVPSLYQLARRACVRNIVNIDSIGDEPYELLRKVLLKVENPDQLHRIEENSPQIIGHDAELWDAFIRRDIPGYDQKPHKPKNPANYWKVYRKLQREKQEELDRAGDLLKEQMESAQAKMHNNSIREITVPKHVAPSRKQMHIARIYGHAAPSGAGKKETFLEKNRRKVMEQKQLAAKMNVPTHQLGIAQVKKAPAAFLDDSRREAAARSRPVPTQIRAPRRAMSGSADDPKPMPGLSMAQREERLKALAAGRTPTSNISQPPSTPTKRLSAPIMGTKRPREDLTLQMSSPESKKLRPTPAVKPRPIMKPGPSKITSHPDKESLAKPGRASEGQPFEKPKALGGWDTAVPRPTATSTSTPEKRQSPPALRGDGFQRRETVRRSLTPESGADRPKKMMRKPPPSVFMPVRKAKLKSR